MTGHITLSPKKKNSVITNIIGAAAYHGNIDILNYILDLKIVKEANNKKDSSAKIRELSLNYKTSEKKIFVKKMTQLSKEMSGLTPIMLSTMNEEKHETAFSIYNRLKSLSNLEERDCEGNTLLHLATRANNEKLVRYFVAEANFDYKDQNNNGDTSYIISQNNKNIEISSYFASLEKSEESLQNNIYSLMEEDFANTHHNQKGKKRPNKKKNPNTEVIGMGISNFQEKNLLNPVKKEPVAEAQPTKTEKSENSQNIDDELDRAFDEVSDEEDYNKEDHENKQTEYYEKPKNYYQNQYNSNEDKRDSYYKKQQKEGNYQYNNNYQYNSYKNKNDNSSGKYDNNYPQKNYNKGYGRNNYYGNNNSNYNDYSGAYNKGGDYYGSKDKNSYNNNKYYNNNYYNSYDNNEQKGYDKYYKKNTRVVEEVPVRGDENKETNKNLVEEVEERAPETKEESNVQEVSCKLAPVEEREKEEVPEANREEVPVETPPSDIKEEAQQPAIQEDDIAADTENEKENVKVNSEPKEENDNENNIDQLLLDEPLNNINLVNEEDMATNTHYLDNLIYTNKILNRTIQTQKHEIEDLKEALILKEINSMVPSTEENIQDLMDLANSQLKIKNKEIKELRSIIFKPQSKAFDGQSKEKLRELLNYYQEASSALELL
eukprot:CAMPEP_0170516344 /NCGR_PEP_ID=MMETSP0209-20121228/2579_1 /TAXON_ID=665100 ORGANISM="Litonotus pictus, Strain P1" /NCGR_SAMPLE_ID=MMETSP0209 /ASSEMBLY_ACC=CAM_ASM_000301 /LENGTH=659 /DNA_ID=CAMNT_0010801185 /DNA_START=374 /DNA_END=2349 /DNA_ORIENTATION=+